MEGEEEKIDGRGREENVQNKTEDGVMEKGEKQTEHVYTTDREKGLKTGFRGEIMQS